MILSDEQIADIIALYQSHQNTSSSLVDVSKRILNGFGDPNEPFRTIECGDVEIVLLDSNKKVIQGFLENVRNISVQDPKISDFQSFFNERGLVCLEHERVLPSFKRVMKLGSLMGMYRDHFQALYHAMGQVTAQHDTVRINFAQLEVDLQKGMKALVEQWFWCGFVTDVEYDKEMRVLTLTNLVHPILQRFFQHDWKRFYFHAILHEALGFPSQHLMVNVRVQFSDGSQAMLDTLTLIKPGEFLALQFESEKEISRRMLTLKYTKHFKELALPQERIVLVFEHGALSKVAPYASYIHATPLSFADIGDSLTMHVQESLLTAV